MTNYQNHKSREEKIREQLSLDDVIFRIEQVYKAEYDLGRPNFDPWDQLLACEAVAESTPINQNYLNRDELNKNPSVSGMINDSCKQPIIFELTHNKRVIIKQLKQFTYLTPPREVAIKLEELFREWKSKESHWLYIAQNWTPRAMNRTINRLIKLHTTGSRSIKNLAAYFTLLINFRKKRKTYKDQ